MVDFKCKVEIHTGAQERGDQNIRAVRKKEKISLCRNPNQVGRLAVIFGTVAH